MIKKLKYILLACRDYYQYWRRASRNFDKPMPIYTKSNDVGLKVHLGAGPVNIQGWINVDARAYDHTHIVAKGFELAEFSDGSVSEIYMCHVLEHFSFVEAEVFLRNIKRKLCVGGVVRISVPSFDKLIAVYADSKNDLDLIRLAIMGGQDYEFNFHKSIYNNASLVRLLGACGYVDIMEWDTKSDFGVDLGDWSNKSFPSLSGSRRISLNLKGRNAVP
jgi:predicted SAM-dependent methyltransferase